MDAYRSLSTIVGVLTVILFAAGGAVAAPVLDFTGGADAAFGADITVGWKFTLASPITIAGLGVFDVGANGLAESHDVGLWTSTGTLLTSTTVTTANSTAVGTTSSAGNWRSTPITPLVLSPGDYVVGAFFRGGGADLAWGDIFDHTYGLVLSTLPDVTYFGTEQFALGSAFQFPANNDIFAIGTLGPNLFTSVVPEPASVVLLGSGFAALAGGMAVRNRRRRH